MPPWEHGYATVGTSVCVTVGKRVCHLGIGGGGGGGSTAVRAAVRTRVRITVGTLLVYHHERHGYTSAVGGGGSRNLRRVQTQQHPRNSVWTPPHRDALVSAETDTNLLPAVIFFNFVGKLGITASYCTIITYAPEMYPTNIRYCVLLYPTVPYPIPYCTIITYAPEMYPTNIRYCAPLYPVPYCTIIMYAPEMYPTNIKYCVLLYPGVPCTLLYHHTPTKTCTACIPTGAGPC